MGSGSREGREPCLHGLIVFVTSTFELTLEPVALALLFRFQLVMFASEVCLTFGEGTKLTFVPRVSAGQFCFSRLELGSIRARHGLRASLNGRITVALACCLSSLGRRCLLRDGLPAFSLRPIWAWWRRQMLSNRSSELQNHLPRIGERLKHQFGIFNPLGGAT